MKKLLLYIVFLFSAVCGYSQNLVSNPSFENYSICPSVADQLSYSTGWVAFCESPDYFNSCSTTGLGIPDNVVGFQNARTGVAYVGFVAYSSLGFTREIIGGTLLQPLIIGTKYYISLNLSLAEFDATSQQYIPCNKTGIKFSTVPFSVSSPVSINNSAHLYTNTIISDTLNWIPISGSFIADSAYQYIMIGNFFDDVNTDTIYRASGAYSYFLLDDICVSTDSVTCSIPTYLPHYINDVSVSIYPNPAKDFVVVECKNAEGYISIYNSLGSKIVTQSFSNHVRLNTSQLPSGVYFFNIESNKGVISSKLILNKE